MDQSAETPFRLTRGLTFLMALACGLAVANIYYNQPLLGIILAEFPGSKAAGVIPTATQLGYAAGLFLLVPLGDQLNRRRLITGQFAFLALALAVTAAAPNGLTMVIASFLVGIGATVAQQIVPFAAALSSPEQRGRTIGSVMAGLLSGILLSRTLAGFIGSLAGWRAVFILGVPLAAGAAMMMARTLPATPAAATRLAYRHVLLSLFSLWREEATLRRATLVQSCLFGSFSVFWTVLALHLQEPAFQMGAGVTGLFGIIGLAGVAAAPLAGRIADRRGPGLVVGLATLLMALSWGFIALFNSVWGLVVGVIVLDLAMQGALVSNQHIVYALRPEARNRLNTIFMTGMFLGGAFGSAGATAAWGFGGWLSVCAFGGGLGAVAAALWLRGRR